MGGGRGYDEGEARLSWKICLLTLSLTRYLSSRELFVGRRQLDSCMPVGSRQDYAANESS